MIGLPWIVELIIRITWPKKDRVPLPAPDKSRRPIGSMSYGRTFMDQYPLEAEQNVFSFQFTLRLRRKGAEAA
jgi:hypothetical protein